MVASIMIDRKLELTILDESTFDEATADDPWLVGFSCPQEECMKMEAALSSVQRSHSLHLRVGLVDCTSASGAPLCLEHGASAPSAILFYKERGFLFEGEHSDDNYLVFVGEGFKQAKSRNRLHLSLKRRLSLKTLTIAAARDFAHQHRYLITICVGLFFVLWGVFIGSAMSTSPALVKASILRQMKLQQKEQQANEDRKKK